MKKIVVPGDEVPGKIINAYTQDNKSFSMIVGLLEEREGKAKIVPLSGRYMPVTDDFIVGIVTGLKHGGAIMDINSPYTAMLITKKRYDIGDVVSAQVTEVNEVKSALLDNDRKLIEGDIMHISPMKVPRVIGKNSSMVTMLKEKTGCNIVVGRNGRVWLKGENAQRVRKIIMQIEEEAHTEGLTERIKEVLEKE